ncbi:MAG: hypothetical protein H6635_00085 [Anaerolineales bacterium]|nr:hypothetical protein [Anaerolineales bacterium]
MQTIDLETSINVFLKLGQQLQSLQPLTGENVLSELFAWYRENRITGTSLIEDGDMLLLQWGVTRPLDIIEPTDLRGVGDEKIKFSDTKFQYLNFTRQVFANYDDKEVEFDDVAIQMRITLCYEATAEKENSDGFWIETPNDVERGEERFRSTPFVNLLMKTPASRVEIVAEHCG